MCTLPMTCDIVWYEANGQGNRLSAVSRQVSSRLRTVQKAVGRVQSRGRSGDCYTVKVDAKPQCSQFPERSHMIDKICPPQRSIHVRRGIRVWISKRVISTRAKWHVFTTLTISSCSTVEPLALLYRFHSFRHDGNAL